MDPYTPKTRSRVRRDKLALSAKQYSKVLWMTYTKAPGSDQITNRSLARSHPFGEVDSVMRTMTTNQYLMVYCSNWTTKRTISSWPFSAEINEPSFIAERSFVSAPLNSRIPAQPVTTIRKGKGKAESLDKLSLEVQEALILEDLLFVLMVCFWRQLSAWWWSTLILTFRELWTSYDPYRSDSRI